MASVNVKHGYLHTFQNSPLAYTLVFFTMTTFYYVFWGGILSVNTSMEKRYSFASWQSGLILGAAEIGRTIALIPMSYFGGKGHVPRISAISTLLCCATMIVIISPHFILDHGGFDHNTTTSDNTSVSDQLCSISPRVNKSAAALQLVADRDAQQNYISNTAFPIFVLAMCLLGVFASPLTNISITYIDINASSAKAPLYIGLASSAISFGSMIGAFVAAWAVTIYVDLSYPPITTSHPEWVGAWWIVMAAVCVGGFVTAPWLFCFPKRMVREGEDSPDLAHELTALAETTVEKVADQNETLSRGLKLYRIRKSFLGMARAIRRIVTNPIYALLTITRLPLEHGLWGYLFFLPKYLEIIYSMESWRVNIIGGVNILCVGVAMIAAGSIVTFFKMSYRRTVQMMLGLGVASLILIVVLFFVACPDVNYHTGETPKGHVAGHHSDTLGTCTARCHCDGVDIAPVCDVKTQVTYLSACDAGCLNTNANTSIDASYTNCDCAASGHVAPGLCGECDTMGAFIAIILLWFVCRGMLSPLVPVTIRSVDEEDRGLAMGLNILVTSLLAWLPTPAEYGAVIDQSCDKWQMLGGEQGYCKIYHRTSFRYYINGLTAGLIALELILMAITLYLVTRYKMTWETKSSKKVES